MSFIVDAISTGPEGRIDARRIGDYRTHDEAVTSAKQVIDAFLFREYRRGAGHGITAQKLLAQYQQSGEVPLILLNSEATTFVPAFDHLEYATKRCSEICAGK